MIRIALALLFVAIASGQQFDATSIKPSGGTGMSCSGGPGTTSPGIWRCSNVPLGWVISQAFGFQFTEFSPRDACCQARFDFDVKIPNGATQDQFHLMLQNLLRERFKLAFHIERKEMAVYELTVGSKGLHMKQSSTSTPAPPEGSWTQSVDKDGYPVWPAGVSRLAGSESYYHWTEFHLSTQDIASTLSEQTWRPVTDATGLQGRYDVDLKWVVDHYSLMSERAKADLEAQVGRPLETGSGPTLERALQDQLGLKMTSKKGTGEVVVIDHVEKVPIEN